MNKRGMIALVLLLPVLAVVFLLGTQSALAGHSLDAQATLCVKPSGGNGCEATIGDALDGAGDGDSIRVATGTYTESVVITKAVTLEGGWNLVFSVRDPAVI